MEDRRALGTVAGEEGRREAQGYPEDQLSKRDVRFKGYVK